MKKPDRLVTLVEQVRTTGNDVHYLSYVVKERDVLALLRREQRAQRARVRRIVKAEKLKTWDGNPDTERAMNLAHRIACNNILAALKGRTR